MTKATWEQHLAWNIMMSTPVSIPHTGENKPIIRKGYTDHILCRAFQYICNQEKQLKTMSVTGILFVRSFETCKFGFLEKYSSKVVVAFAYYAWGMCVIYIKQKKSNFTCISHIYIACNCDAWIVFYPIWFGWETSENFHVFITYINYITHLSFWEKLWTSCWCNSGFCCPSSVYYH